MERFINPERLHRKARERLLPYLEELIGIHGDNIVSIFIYGSVASGEYIHGSSDINSAFVFKRLEFAQLKASLKTVNRGIRKAIAAPLFLTPEYIKRSLDTFPVEFLDMKENHILLYGEDLLKDLSISPVNIRFVCEEELKGKLIRIRQAYLEIGLQRKGIESLIKESLNSLIPIFRSLLRLKNITPPAGKENIIKALASTLGVDAEIFTTLLKSGGHMGTDELEGLLKRYIQQIERLADISDRL